MRVVIILEHRFDQTPDGIVWTHTMFPYDFWTGYLAVFDSVLVIARVRRVPTVPTDWKTASGESISFAGLPYYIGPWQYLLAAPRVHRTIKYVIDAHDAVIMRVPSQLAVTIAPTLRRCDHPYGLEVLGDPYEVFSPGAVKHPLRPFFRWWFTRHLRQQCLNACALSYVTRSALQGRYPPAPGMFSTNCSDVDLPDTAFTSVPRKFDSEQRFILIFVGSLEQLYKAPDVLLDALELCVHRYRLDLALVIVGDGRYRRSLEQQAKTLGVDQRVRFLGQLAVGAAVREQLNQADIFILPSRTEGLPRAMLEAMACGLPIIGSNVGGIPELLSPDDIVLPNDAAALAQKIRETVTNPLRMAHMSKRNLKKAREYHARELRTRSIEFYYAVRDKTQLWLDENRD